MHSKYVTVCNEFSYNKKIWNVWKKQLNDFFFTDVKQHDGLQFCPITK